MPLLELIDEEERKKREERKMEALKRMKETTAQVSVRQRVRSKKQETRRI